VNPAPQRSENRPPSGRIANWRARIERFLTQDVWTEELSLLPRFRRWLYKVARVVYLTVRGVNKDRCTSRAAALTYVTVLSIVPLLALAFSVAKGLDAYKNLRETVITPFLEDLDPETGSNQANGELEIVMPKEGANPDGAASTDAANPGATDTNAATVSPGEAVDGGTPVTDEVLAGEADSQASGQLREAADRILDLVENTDFGSLGAVGLLLLMYTVLKLLSSIEGTMNDIWGVHRSRTWTRKVSDYISMLVIVPMLLMASAGLTATLKGDWLPEVVRDTGFFRSGILPVFKVLALLAPVVGFTFIYLFIPNTRVRVRSALWGGLLGGVLWQALIIAHVQFQLGVARTNAIYSTFAALPVFLVWLFMAWNIVLLGAELACAHQNEPNYGQVARAREFDPRLLESVAVRAMMRIGQQFRSGDQPLNTADLSDRLGVPVRTLNDVLGHLTANRLLIMADTDGHPDGHLVPGRALGTIRIQQILDALKGPISESHLDPHDELDNFADSALARFRSTRDGDASNQVLSDLLDSLPED
jgi:YihY family inner membrane protein